MTCQEIYEAWLKDCGITEEKFLHIYEIREKDGQTAYWNEIHKLPEVVQKRFCHLIVAYRRLLKERGESNNK